MKKSYILAATLISFCMIGCGKQTKNEPVATESVAIETNTVNTESTEVIEPIITQIVEEDTTETVVDTITVEEETGNLVIDTDKVEITTDEEGNEVATIKTEDGEVTVSVTTDETGKVVVDNKKIESETTSKENTTSTVEQTIKVDDKGNVVIEKTETVISTVTVIPTEKPVETKTNTSTEEPKVTEEPKITVEPTKEITVEPTNTPTNINKPTEVVITSVPTNVSTVTNTSVPTKIPTLVPTSTPKFTSTPIPTNTVKPTNIPTSTPKPTSTPIPTNTVKPTSTPTSAPKPTNTPIPTSTPIPHTHSWTPIYSTVHHDEVGHYEDVYNDWDEYVYVECAWFDGADGTHTSLYQLLVDNGLWDIDDIIAKGTNERVIGYEYKGQNTTLILRHKYFNSERKELFNSYARKYGYTTGSKIFIDTIKHHDFVEKVWVIDKAAYDEQVITRYKCSCGATK